MNHVYIFLSYYCQDIDFVSQEFFDILLQSLQDQQSTSQLECNLYQEKV